MDTNLEDLMENLMTYLESRFKPKDLQPLIEDDYDINSWCGGNVDDAFSLGVSAGYADAIQEIMNFFPKKDDK